ncbi:restriction endonuclease subunit S [Micromonospora sp. DT43]|uniref:restriction endonuclease subunit S n=1 Tax=Micromonospora sp. DT43 TaxID=3393440 RepID=UPI003CF41921
MTNEDVPAGWKQSPLGDVSTLVRNGLFARRPVDEPIGVPILRISAVRNGRLDLADIRYVPELEPAAIAKYSLRPGDLLFTRYNGSRRLVGRCAPVPTHEGPIIHPDKLIRVVPRYDVIDSRFLALQAESGRVRRFLEPRIKTTAGQSGITGTDIRELPVAYPELREQRRIVEILEDHFTRLDAADGYVADSVSRARKLVSSALLSEQLITSAQQKTLKQLLGEPLSNGRSVPTREGGFPVLRLTALKADGVDLKEHKEGAWSADEARPFLVEHGDFLVSRGNGSLRLVARGALVLDKPFAVAYPDTLIRVRIDPGQMLPQFLSAVWNSPLVRRQIEAVARTTAGIYKVNQRQLEAIVLPAPKLDDQMQACSRIERIRVTAVGLSDALEISARRSAALRRALLTAAFSGQLTGQTTDLEIAEEVARV